VVVAFGLLPMPATVWGRLVWPSWHMGSNPYVFGGVPLVLALGDGGLTRLIAGALGHASPHCLEQIIVLKTRSSGGNPGAFCLSELAWYKTWELYALSFRLQRGRC